MTIRPFAEVLQSGKFLVTAELNPPKGTTWRHCWTMPNNCETWWMRSISPTRIARA